MSNIDKDIENVKEIINNNYLEDLGYLREENDYIIYNQSMSNVLTELETYKKIAELFGKSLINISGEKTSLEELIDWARKEVENK